MALDHATHLKNKKWILFVAHPGHELHVHHWLELTQPTTFILTDGSGRQKNISFDITDKILKNAGAKKGKIYSHLTDADIYRIMLEGDIHAVKKIVILLSNYLVDEKINGVCGNAVEHYNPTHDLSRYLLNAAILLAEKKSQKIMNYDFTLTGNPAVCPKKLTKQSIKIELDDAALKRKLMAARDYPGLSDAVDAAMAKFSATSFALEYLRPVATEPLLHTPAKLPFYEKYGEEQVKQGYYQHVIRFQNHLRPLIEKLYMELGLS